MNDVHYDHWFGFHYVFVFYAIIAAICVAVYHYEEILTFLIKLI